jgi:hypothetical protein
MRLMTWRALSISPYHPSHVREPHRLQVARPHRQHPRARVVAGVVGQLHGAAAQVQIETKFESSSSHFSVKR